MAQTTRDRILSYIENMAPGDRITVKSIAQELGTSPEITYQVIREAERRGALQFRTSPKQESAAGKDLPQDHRQKALSQEDAPQTDLAHKTSTQSIDSAQTAARKPSSQTDSAAVPLKEDLFRESFLTKEATSKASPEPLTLRTLADITEAQICCGEEYLDRQPSKFLVAAMDLRAMANYLIEGSLCIVGNRTDAQMLALENKSSLLITGLLFPSNEVLGYAKEIGAVIMVTPYETFITTSLINLALYAEYEKVVFVGGELLPQQRPEEENIEHRFIIDYKFEKTSVLSGLVHPWMVNAKKELKYWIMNYLLEYSQTAFLRDQYNLTTFTLESCYHYAVKPARLGERIRLTTKTVARQKDSATLETEVIGERGTILAKSISKYKEEKHPALRVYSDPQ